MQRKIATGDSDRSSRKRLRDNHNSEDPPAPEIGSDGTLTFSLQGIHKHLICGLCNGYYKEPYVLPDCGHTYCKSCLLYSVSNGCFECPHPGCEIYIGRDPHKVVTERNAVLDRNLQDFIDRIVFPELPSKEKKEEEAFYAKLGIALKPEFALRRQRDAKSLIQIAGLSSGKVTTDFSENAETVEFTLLPEVTEKDQQLPLMKFPCLAISGKFRINQLKKYLLAKLGMEDSSLTSLDIICDGVSLGNEMSLSYAQRMLWHEDSEMALTYLLESGNDAMPISGK